MDMKGVDTTLLPDGLGSFQVQFQSNKKGESRGEKMSH